MARKATGSNRSASSRHRSARDTTASIVSSVDHRDVDEDDDEEEDDDDDEDDEEDVGVCVDADSRTLTSNW